MNHYRGQFYIGNGQGSLLSPKIEFFIKSAQFHKIQCLFVLQESFQQLWHYKRVAAQVVYMTLHLVVRSIF